MENVKLKRYLFALFQAAPRGTSDRLITSTLFANVIQTVNCAVWWEDQLSNIFRCFIFNSYSLPHWLWRYIAVSALNYKPQPWPWFIPCIQLSLFRIQYYNPVWSKSPIQLTFVNVFGRCSQKDIISKQNQNSSRDNQKHQSFNFHKLAWIVSS